MNTKETRKDNGGFVETKFLLDCLEHDDLLTAGLLAGHEPSCTDILSTPFYPDPSQRVLAVRFVNRNELLVMRLEMVLRLVEEREGEELGRGEWEDLVTWVEPTCMFLKGP